MESIKDKIVSTENKLIDLRNKYNASLESIKKVTGGNYNYHNSFKDKCLQALCLFEGLIYSPYHESHRLHRGQEWKKENYYDYCSIYNQEGFGSPIGFISTEIGLFEATKDKHKEMWIKAINEKKETRSFNDFIENLKSDVKFLIECFELRVRENGCGAFSTNPYLMEFEEKKLKTEKFYIYYNNTTRRL